MLALDKDGSGTITFMELLMEMYPFTPRPRLKAMLETVLPPTVEPVARPRDLSQEQLDEIEAVFYLYDTDGSGAIEKEELVSLHSH